MLHITLYITQAALAITLFFMWINLINFKIMRKRALATIDTVMDMHKRVDELSAELKKSSQYWMNMEIEKLHREFSVIKQLSEQYRFKQLNILVQRMDDFEDKLEAKFPNP